MSTFWGLSWGLNFEGLGVQIMLRRPAGQDYAIRTVSQGLSRICVQRVIWTRRTLFSESLDTQKFMSEFAEDDFS